ncbi:MAG: peptide-methionine (S)-S-oxide reductase MsrA, partial [Hyphomicrobiales bacterium]
GLTGHAEIVKVKFDDSIVKFDELLDIFWNIHDPTQINRQGVDIGTQYRSCIFTNFDPYLDKIKKSIEDMNNSETYSNPISTIIYNTIKYYPAEDYHQKYLFRNALQ